MKLPRDVILDLLPLYMAGEASADTRRLVEAHLADDPDLARTVRDGAIIDPPRSTGVVSPDTQLRSLLATRRRLRLRAWIVGLALFFTLFPFSFFHDGHETHWLWAKAPGVAVALGVVALALWTVYLRFRRAGGGL
jgi:hypothetical protein